MLGTENLKAHYEVKVRILGTLTRGIINLCMDYCIPTILLHYES